MLINEKEEYLKFMILIKTRYNLEECYNSLKFKKKLMEESEGRIMISLSEYKYSEEEAALAVEAFEHQWDKYY